MNYATTCPWGPVNANGDKTYCDQAECELWDRDMDCCCFNAIAIHLGNAAEERRE